MNMGQFLGQRYLREEGKEDEPLEPPERSRPIDYVELGRKGGLKGGHERAKRLTPDRRREIARQGGIARHKPKE